MLFPLNRIDPDLVIPGLGPLAELTRQRAGAAIEYLGPLDG